MKVGIYNRYWSTGGGAEKYGGVLAEVLSEEHEVELLGPDLVDLDVLGARMGMDLSRCTLRVLRDRVGVLTKASADYELFVNVSYASAEPNAARHGIYVVHFPTAGDTDLSGVQRLAIRAFGPLVRRQAVDTEWGTGFYPREGGRPRVFWTSGSATFLVVADREQTVPVRLAFVDRRPPGVGPASVQVAVDGEQVADVVVGGSGGRLARRRSTEVVVQVPARPGGVDVPVTITSDTFVPADVLGGDDDRELGVALTAMHTGAGFGARLGATVGAFYPLLYRPLPTKRFYESYDLVVANSAFTQTWIQRWWKVPSTVLHPPVVMQQRQEKEAIILNVGRFFDARAGHSKKQLEMVEAFRSLHEQGGAPGWSLHLVGGCAEADRPYLERVQAAAEGLPVHLHVDAPGPEVRDLYGRASIYWHATGFGEDPEAEPGRLEHFGIATVEAMSGGAVPVVIGLAGQLEVLDDGVEGFHWLTLEQLVSRTQLLIDQPEQLRRMSQAAEARAQDFGVPAFAERLRGLVAQVVGSPSGAGRTQPQT
jgi:glycosyltransferase involved in cell wall biosynthesis